ncbi:MAG: hypothetical protein IJQ98_02045 [Oscillospiraceae bacterium]|nr:hypothetical protein [Oscillospiraceae bacterium]
MKTRAQLYQMEASGLLRDLSEYRCLKKEQVYGLYPGKEKVIKNLLVYLLRSGRISRVDDYYCDAPESVQEIDRSLIDAVWVLIDFIDQVEYHATGNFPVKIVFCANNEVYEIIHAGVGKEALVSYIASERKKDENATKFIVMVDKPEQIDELRTDNAVGYCTVAPDGKVQYFQKEE